jgi:hypothetical protein
MGVDDPVVAILVLSGSGVVLVLLLAWYVATTTETQASGGSRGVDVPLDDLPEELRPYHWAAHLGDAPARRRREAPVRPGDTESESGLRDW